MEIGAAIGGHQIEEINAVVKSGKFDFIELVMTPETDVERLVERREQIRYIHAGCNPRRWNPGGRDHWGRTITNMDAALRVSDKLGRKPIIIHPGWAGFPETIDAATQTTNDFLRLIDRSRILVENGPRHFRRGIGFVNAFRVCKESDCEVCLDLAHLYEDTIAGKAPFVEILPKIRHFHITDGNANDLTDDLHQSLGKGTFDIGTMKIFVTDLEDYVPTMTIELDHALRDDTAEPWRRELEYWKSL